MSAVAVSPESLSTNPLDLAEQLVMDREWLFDRPDDGELVAEALGSWCNFRLWFTWQEEMGVVIFSCAYDTKIPPAQRARIFPLLAAVNEKLWVGHFDLCSEDGAIMFRHALLARGEQRVSAEQLEDVMDIGIAECDRFYPAFQSVLWGGNTIPEALQIALLETVGEA